MELKIFSNWGDKYLVGLNGIEMFDAEGIAVQIKKVIFKNFLLVINTAASSKGDV